MLNDRDPDPRVSIVRSDRLVSKCNGCLGAVCLREQKNLFKQYFVFRAFFSPRILQSPLHQEGNRRCAEGAKTKLNEIKAGQSDAVADKLSDNRLLAALRCAA